MITYRRSYLCLYTYTRYKDSLQNSLFVLCMYESVKLSMVAVNYLQSFTALERQS